MKAPAILLWCYHQFFIEENELCERPVAFERRLSALNTMSGSLTLHPLKASIALNRAFHQLGFHKRALNCPGLYAFNSFLLVSKKEKQKYKSKLNRGNNMKQFTMTLQKILPGSPKSCSSMLPRTAKYVSLIFW